MQLSRARDGNDPWLLRQQPGKRDLSRRRLFLLCEPADQINQRVIGFPVLRGKTRNNVAEITFVELRVFADLASEEAFTQRTERNEPDAELLKRGYHFP